MVSHKAAVLRSFAALAGMMLAAGAACGEVVTFVSSVDGSDQPYALYTPKDIKKDRRYPLIVSLHGAGQTHRQGLRQVWGVPAKAPLADVDYFIAAPFGRGSMGYEGISETDVFDMLERVKAIYPIDENRVYLTGVSMGGSGTLSIALRRPDLWAAIAVVCGGAPSGTIELAGNALHLPVHLFHGDKDTTVPVEIGRRWQELFRAAGVDVTYREFAGEGHNIAPLAYKDGYIFDWFAKHRRKKAPQRVRFATARHAHNSAYWVTVNSFEARAEVDARTAGGILTIQAKNVYGLTLDLRGLGAKRLEIGGARMDLKGDRVHLRRERDIWTAVSSPVRDGKRPGFDGPMISVLARQHSYVYGGHDAEVAQRAADWAGRRARPAVSFPVVGDREPLPSTGNLVIFGVDASNKLLREHSDKFPLALKPEATGEYGLVFAAPLTDRMAVVSSGLPWWTGASAEQQQGFRFQWLSLPYRLLIEWPDFVLFRRSVGEIVASGTFDRNWRLNAADAEKLRATGVVLVRE